MIWSIFLLYLSWNLAATNAYSTDELFMCGAQLTSFKRFIINLFMNLDDTCDHIKYFDTSDNIDSHISEYNSRPFKEKLHDTIFSQTLKFAYNDLEFYVMLQNALMEKCQQKMITSSFMQGHIPQKKSEVDKNTESSSEKRNSVIIGKKQRFNPWGGKRSSGPSKLSLPDIVGNIRLPGNADTSFVY